MFLSEEKKLFSTVQGIVSSISVPLITAFLRLENQHIFSESVLIVLSRIVNFP